MFANLFKRAEASVDNAIGDLGNRVVIAIPFLIALGFAASSLSIALNNAYGAEIGNLLVAGAFCGLGLLVAVVVNLRSRPSPSDAATDADASKQEAESQLGTNQSIFDDETLMAVVSSAAPIVLPALIRTGLKNWHLLLAIAAGLYVCSRPDQTFADVQST